MKRFVNGLILTALLAPLFSSFGQENMVLNYKGRLRVEGAPFSGTGYFMFVLEDKNGQIFWSSGDFPYAGAAVNPTNTLKIPVKEGDYVARLGASGTGMPPLNLADLRRIPNPRLKI